MAATNLSEGAAATVRRMAATRLGVVRTTAVPVVLAAALSANRTGALRRVGANRGAQGLVLTLPRRRNTLGFKHLLKLQQSLRLGSVQLWGQWWTLPDTPAFAGALRRAPLLERGSRDWQVNRLLRIGATCVEACRDDR